MFCPLAWPFLSTTSVFLVLELQWIVAIWHISRLHLPTLSMYQIGLMLGGCFSPCPGQQTLGCTKKQKQQDPARPQKEKLANGQLPCAYRDFLHPFLCPGSPSTSSFTATLSKLHMELFRRRLRRPPEPCRSPSRRSAPQTRHWLELRLPGNRSTKTQ